MALHDWACHAAIVIVTVGIGAIISFFVGVIIFFCFFKKPDQDSQAKSDSKNDAKSANKSKKSSNKVASSKKSMKGKSSKVPGKVGKSKAM